MKKALTAIGLVIWTAVIFALGYVYREHRLLHGGRYVTTENLELRKGPSEIGSLPAGSTLYDYGSPYEPPMFVLFVNTKSLVSLRPEGSENWLEISPVEAYLP